MLSDDRAHRIAAEAERLEREFPHAVDARLAGQRKRWALSNDSQVKLLTFGGMSLAVVASSDVAPAWLRLTAGAIAAGCGGVVALLRQVGSPHPPEAGKG